MSYICTNKKTAVNESELIFAGKLCDLVKKIIDFVTILNSFSL